MSIKPGKEYAFRENIFYGDIEDLDFLSKEELDALKQFVNQDNELVFPEGTKIMFEPEDKLGRHGIIHGVSLDFIFEDEDTQLMELF